MNKYIFFQSTFLLITALYGKVNGLAADNRITNHIDAVLLGNYPHDLDNEPKNNYRFNAIGERAKDSANGIDTIEWTVYGKVREIKKYNGDSIIYRYDPLGRKLEARYYTHSGATDTTNYTRDASDMNMQCIFMESINNRRKDTVRLQEWDMYGNKRIGSTDTNLRIYPAYAKHNGGALDSATIAYFENQKQYELDNHLGNVLVTISDRKWPIDTAHLGYAQYYLPTIITANDYYPYGQYEPGRQYSLTHYNFGFNGKLKDDSIFGAGNWYDYGMRGIDWSDRFLSVDPLTRKYAYYSPYQFAGGNPIKFIDLDGKEPGAIDLALLINDGNKQDEQTGERIGKYLIYGAIATIAAPFNLISDMHEAGNVRDHGGSKQQQQEFENDAKRPIAIIGLTALTDGVFRVGFDGLERMVDDIKIPFKPSENMIYTGSKEFTIIGEGMDENVIPYAQELEKEGYKVNIFKPSEAATNDWKRLQKKYDGKQIPDAAVKNSIMYKENMSWAQKAKTSNTNLIDLGGTGKSTFYKGEKDVFYGSSTKKKPSK